MRALLEDHFCIVGSRDTASNTSFTPYSTLLLIPYLVRQDGQQIVLIDRGGGSVLSMYLIAIHPPSPFAQSKSSASWESHSLFHGSGLEDESRGIRRCCPCLLQSSACTAFSGQDGKKSRKILLC
ncbi:hypothetical protein CEXT_463861 [Caerostris extrusa]|uniref:Uncharacterized protein n=1 Tax=Caerostris extrusa TaxID=172846 RepID=A0AAV4NS36_CAEEX|nr:hypothetical protein CEXT_463861 [Caerostris extrusa]